jgi:hypothetical protein
MVVKSKLSAPKCKRKKPGNYIDAFVKRMFGQIVIFSDFLLHYADKEFVAKINLKKIQLEPTHYFGKDGDERIVDLIFKCPLKRVGGSLMAVIVFEHQSGSLEKMPLKLLKYISAIWNKELNEGQPLSLPYFIVLRTAKRPHKGVYPTILDSFPKECDDKLLGHVPKIKYDVLDLPAKDFGKLEGGAVLRLVLGLLHKMTGDNIDEFPEALKPLLEITDEAQQIELTKELMDFVNRAFAAHNRLADEVTWQKALHPIFKGKETTMIKTIFEEKYDAGVDEGIAIGAVRGKAETVLAILRARFKRIPKEVESAIRQMTDLIALESLAVQASTCQSMDEFVKALL